jgi:hypothetical protein
MINLNFRIFFELLIKLLNKICKLEFLLDTKIINLLETQILKILCSEADWESIGIELI